MYEFADKLINVSLPRVRDFRGVPVNSFDGRGNYSLGVKEQLIFPEIDYDKIDKIRGMDITFVTTARPMKRQGNSSNYWECRLAKAKGGFCVAKKSLIVKQQRKPKYRTRAYNRCKLCGRPHAYMRKSDLSSVLQRLGL